jgi:acylphosphatase
MTAYRVTVVGKIQGVFFRKCTLEKALELKLRGWVRNEPDGDVVTQFEGDEEACHQMLDWLKEGSPRSRVDKLLIEEAEESRLADFEIRY